jgi:large subunit ribosomal protein L21
MQAVIRTGGKQYLVTKDQTLEIELTGDAKKLELETLLVIDGEKITLGKPLVKDVTVKAEVLGEVKGDKIRVMKFKAKKRIKKTTGHRQKFTQIKITAIG